MSSAETARDKMRIDDGGLRILSPDEKGFVDRVFPGWQLHQSTAQPKDLWPLYGVGQQDRSRAFELKPRGVRMRILQVLTGRDQSAAEGDNNDFEKIFGTEDTCEAAAQIFEDPDTWLDTPSQFVDGMSPRALIGTPAEEVIKEHLLRIALGIPT